MGVNAIVHKTNNNPSDHQQKTIAIDNMEICSSLLIPPIDRNAVLSDYYKANFFGCGRFNANKLSRSNQLVLCKVVEGFDLFGTEALTTI